MRLSLLGLPIMPADEANGDLGHGPSFALRKAVTGEWLTRVNKRLPAENDSVPPRYKHASR